MPLIPRAALSLLFAFATAALLAGCDSHFEEVNENPNQPETVDPSLLLPNVIRGPVNTSVVYAHTTGNLVMQYAAKVQFAGGVDRYAWDFGGYWDELYADLRNTDELIAISQARGLDNYHGVGLVMKSWIFSLLADAYGRVPYTEALQGEDGAYTPTYDTQETVYEGLLADLRRANELIDPAAGAISGDILYGGDLSKWKKLANALRLRLLMRLSARRDVSAALQEIVGNPEAYPVFESNADNAALEYLESPPNEWPIHTTRLGSFRTYRLSQTLGDTLLAYNDPRLPVYADPTAASLDSTSGPEYVGVPNGLFDDESTNFNGGSFYQSTLNSERYFEEPDRAKGRIMTYSEVLFIKAEAAARGWIEGAPAQLYRAGIQASFDYYGVAPPSGYFEQPEVSYASDPQRALEQIGTQKWIALFYTGLEAWFDWRRTGFPQIEPSVRNQNNDLIPVRFRYPSAVQSLNGENYQQAVAEQGPDDINTHLWVDPENE